MPPKIEGRQKSIFERTGAYDKFPSLQRAREADKTNRSGSSRSKSQTRTSDDEKTQDVARGKIQNIVQFSNNGPSNLHRRRISASNHHKLPLQVRPGTQSLPGSRNASPVSSDDGQPYNKSKIPRPKQGSLTPTIRRKTVEDDDQGSEIRELSCIQQVEAGIASGSTDMVLQNLIVKEIGEAEMTEIISTCGAKHNFTLLKLIYDQVSSSYKKIHFHTASIALANFLRKGALSVLESAFKNLSPRDASKMLIAVLNTRSVSQLEKFVKKANTGSKDDLHLIEAELKNAMDEAIQSEFALGLNILLSHYQFSPQVLDLQLPKCKHPEIVRVLATFASEEACRAALKAAEKDPELSAAIQRGMRDNQKIAPQQQANNELSLIEEVSENRPASAAPTEVSHAPSASNDAPPEVPAFFPRQENKDPLNE